MDAIYYLSGLLLMATIGVGIVGGIRPSVFQKFFKKYATRKHIIIGSLVMFFAFSGVLAATEPASVRQARLDAERTAQQQTIDEEEAQRRAEEEANKETTKEVTVTEEVPYTSETKNYRQLAAANASL